MCRFDDEDFFKELFFANAPNNRFLEDKVIESINKIGRMTVVMVRKTPLLLYLGKLTIGNELEDKK